MAKAISNTDTEFLENLTAQALTIKKLCQDLAELADRPDELDVLQNIYHTGERIRTGAIRQREF
jgi:hypothetical protein